jgi:hypothetical protein
MKALAGKRPVLAAHLTPPRASAWVVPGVELAFAGLGRSPCAAKAGDEVKSIKKDIIKTRNFAELVQNFITSSPFSRCLPYVLMVLILQKTSLV